MKASLTNYRQAPRKVRLVAGLLKGKKVPNALTELAFLPKRASLPLKKLIDSAVANAKNVHGINADTLMIKSMSVDKGVVLKRSMPRARGSAYPIHKHTSHVVVELAEIVETKGKKTTRKTKASNK